jgi:LacI family transcriptional regulator
MSTTTKDLAKLCGVSRTTIHRALHDTGRINEDTKTRILKIAEENGYRPDLLARGLVKGKTNSIGIVVLDINNRHFSEMLNSAGTEARENGYLTNICLHNNNEDTEKELVERLAGYKVDGILLSSINKGKKYGNYLSSLNIPIVTVDNVVSDDLPYVGIDESKAIENEVAKVVRRDYKKIVFVCPALSNISVNSYVHEQRLSGFMKSQKKFSNVDFQVVREHDYLPSCLKLIADHKVKTVFLCTSDMYALDLMKYMDEKGYLAPQDYGICGFDNIDTLDYLKPRLDTVDNSVKDVGAKAIDLLINMIDGKSIEIKNILPYKLIDGETL